MTNLSELKLNIKMDDLMEELEPLLHELDYLRFFHSEADFGPAHGDVVSLIDEAYTEETGRQLPEGY